MNWILASGSPRRRELLEMLGVPDLTIRPATGPERATPGAGPEQTVRELSLHKAQEVAQTCAPEDIIIAADTIVYLDGAILGKPRDHDDAARMLTALSGREHIVYTGVAVLRGGELRQAAERTAVRFRTLTPEEIDENTIANHLYTAGQPDPDLLIRSSGELRLSNFLLWQVAYTEFWITNTYWPDFRAGDLFDAVYAYQKRDRRYGGLKK